MISTALLILPDFALMLLGLLLAHRLGFDRGFWNGTEKLVYYVLFPPLLFNAIVHSHSRAVIPFGTSTVPIKPVFHNAAFIGAGLPVFDIRDSAGMSDMLVSNAGRGDALARKLGAEAAVLMRGHGVAVVGPSLRHAVGRSIYLEENARIQLEAIGLGGMVKYLAPEEAAA